MRALFVAIVALLSWPSVRADDRSSPIDIAMYGSVATLVTDTPVGFALVDARIPVTSRITAAAGLAQLDPAGPREEQQVRLSLTAAFPAEKYSFEDRLLWVRSDANVTQWRNRWRASVPLSEDVRWVMFDELYYSEPRRFYRNVVAAGVNLSVASRVTSEVLYLRIDNRHDDVSHGLLFMVSLRLD